MPGGTRQMDLPSSKIKRIAIELKDYHFFHSPFQIKHQSKYYVGREKKINQFRKVIIDASSDSGNYLVTGYRGSGKTSFINMALANITAMQRRSNRNLQFYRLFFLLSIPFYLVMFDYAWLSQLIWFSILVLCGVSLWLLDPNRPVSSKYRTQKGLLPLCKKTGKDQNDGSKNPEAKKAIHCFSVPKLLRTLFYVSKDENLNYTLINLIRGIFLLAIITFVFSFFRNSLKYLNYEFLITSILFVYWSILVFSDLKSADTKYKLKQTPGKKNGHDRNFLIRLLKYIIIIRKESIQALLKSRIAIRLNLNYENLTERNILWLIASSLYEEYRRWRRTPLQIGFQIIKAFVIYLFIVIPYQVINLNTSINDWLVKNIFNDLLQNIFYKTGSYCYEVGEVISDFWPFKIIEFLINRSMLSDAILYIYPEEFNPLLILIFLVAWQVIGFVCKKQWFYIPGHARVIYMLKELEERMTAAVHVESGIDFKAAGSPFSIPKLFYKKNLNRPLADERTIEQGIIRILDEISRIPTFLGHPVFIFIFDELDKITPSNKSEQEPASYKVSFESIRNRQQEVEKILTNLKQLITTAHAKFVFVAGREMFDASLADFTSRAFIHSSIFNQIFYVDSFLSDRSDPGEENLFGLVESYVCQFLLGNNNTKSWPKIEDYVNFIMHRYDFTYLGKEKLNSKDNKELTGEEKQQIIQKARYKISRVLHDFVIYLTYRGSGSPKKIIQLFESFIQKLPRNRKPEEWLVIGDNHESLYLVFNFPHQYIIGSTARLLEPILHPIERTARYNDKLTTAIFMVLDYLFKFHRSAFCMSFLERMPEMLNIHRDPDLRNIIQEILALIETNYLEKVQNGLFGFQFNNLIRGEIDYVSRIDERESAAYNFTLDESLETEQFFRRQLRELEKEKSERDVGQTSAIKYLHEIIGDFHAFDEEHDQAIAEYNCALFSENSNPTIWGSSYTRELDATQLLNLRLWLKIGLTYEKIGDWGQASVSYSEACRIALPYFSRVNWHKLASINDFKIMFLPILCKAWLDEKDPQKKHADFKKLSNFLADFETLYQSAENADSFAGLSNLSLFYVICLNQTANLYYYKGFVIPGVNNQENRRDEFYFLDRAQKNYIKSIKILCSNYLSGDESLQFCEDSRELVFKIIEVQAHLANLNTSVFQQLAISLGFLGNVRLCKLNAGVGRKNYRFNLNFLTAFLYEWYDIFEMKHNHPMNLDEVVLNDPIIEISACYLLAARFFLRAAMRKEAAYEYEKMIRLLRYVDFAPNSFDESSLKTLHTDLEKFIFRYGEKYLQLSYRKVVNENWENQEAPKSQKANFTHKVPDIRGFQLEWIRLEYKLFESASNRLQEIQKELNRQRKIYFELKRRYKIQMNWNQQCEILMQLEHQLRVLLQLNTRKHAVVFRGIKDFEEKINTFVRGIDSLDIFDNVKNRINRLNLKEEMLSYCYEQLQENTNEENSGLSESSNKIISDAFFCCLNSIDLREIHSNTNWWLHLGRAQMHLSLANWIQRREDQTLKSEMKADGNDLNMVGKMQEKYINKRYQLQQALENFHQVRQTHTGGSAYKALIQRMYFLNGDFNDRGYHFYLAIERFELERGKVLKNIKDVKERMIKLDTI